MISGGNFFEKPEICPKPPMIMGGFYIVKKNIFVKEKYFYKQVFSLTI
jgi:hypothetical protein